METEKHFDYILHLIANAKEKTILAVNNNLIELYWNIGKYINKKINDSDWGKSIVNNLSIYINKQLPDLKGFSSQNLWRMKQFYELYSENEKLSALVRELN